MRGLLLSLLVLIISGCSTLTNGTPDTVSLGEGDDLAAEEPAAVSQTPEVEPQPAPSATASAYRADLEDYGPAPELANDTWLNAGEPLRLADLRGQVVLIDMWTFG